MRISDWSSDVCSSDLVCQPIQATGLPSQPRAITVNQGRLVVLTDQVLAWSWQSDGRNFPPALGEAGAQVISARVAGFPIMVSNYAGGVLTWTTGGQIGRASCGGRVCKYVKISV